MKTPKVGDKIYVPTRWFIGRPEDDTEGGLAVISRVRVEECDNPYNTVFIWVKELPGVGFNYSSLLEGQKKLKREFGKKRAHPDPDYNCYGSDCNYSGRPHSHKEIYEETSKISKK